MKVSIEKYPYNHDCVVIITLDDLHPERKKDLEGLDFGGNFAGNFWSSIDYLTHKLPFIKFTIFAVANWIDRSDFPDGVFWPARVVYRKRRSYPVDTFKITNKKFRSWIKKINDYAKHGFFEVGLHGLFHHNSSLEYSHSQELLGLSNKNLDEKISEMVKIFTNSRLRFEYGFRPPGWGMTTSLKKILVDHNFLYTADKFDFSSSAKRLKTIHLNNNLVEFEANCYPEQISRALDIAKNDGVIIVQSHIAKTVWGIKYIDKYFSRNIEKLINEVRYQTLKDIWFCSLSDLAKFYLARNKLTYKITKDEVKFTNNSKYDLLGLTVKISGRLFIIDKIEPGATHSLLYKIYSSAKLVSLIVTVYNGEKNILNCLRSLANQTYQNNEIFIINDGSTDKTVKIVKKFIRDNPGINIKLINQANLGRAESKQKGLKASRGEIVAFCEDDAIYSKNYIKEAVAVLDQSNKKVAGVIGPHFVANRNDTIWTRVKDLERRRNFINYQPKSAWVYKKSSLESVNGFNASLEFGEDIEPCLKLIQSGYSFRFVNNCLWLHQEPKALINILKRRFKGGLGMAVLYKKGIIPNPLRGKLGLFLFLVLGLVVISHTLNSYLWALYFILILGLFLAGRISELLKLENTYFENRWFIILGIYIEYIWWAATFCGLLIGFVLSSKKVNETLRGR